MQMPATPRIRLFSPQELVADSELWLTGEQAKYLSRVLRLKTDDTVVLFDGNGGHYPAVIKAFARHKVLLEVGQRDASEIESPLAVQLVQGISRGRRMDVVVQKSTELGVRRITPVTTEFSVVKFDADKALRRHEHWIRISQSACEQCGRNTLPEIDPPQTLQDWLEGLEDDSAMRAMLDPMSSEPLAGLPAPEAAVILLIGPEGGLSDAEKARCEKHGFRGVSLGPRTLRTETAALAGIAVLPA